MWRAITAPFAKRVERAAMDPRMAQEKALTRILGVGRDSALGRRFGYDRVSRLEDMKRLPFTEWSDYRDDVERVFVHGDAARNVFGKSPVVAIAFTSGTSAAPKRYPVTKATIASFRRSVMDIQGCVLTEFQAWGDLTTGKQIGLANAALTEKAPCGLPCGHMSGILTAASPKWVKRRLLPTETVMQEAKWEARMIRLLEEARGQDVRYVGGFTAALKSFAEVAIRHLGVNSLDQVWPNLRMLSFGGAPLSESTRSVLREMFVGGSRGPLFFVENYSSVEGMHGHTFRRDWPGLAWSAYENVYLFTEPGNDAKALLLHELEAGMRVSIAVTNPTGLVNYRLGDLVEITSHRPLTFRVVGRTYDQVTLSYERFTTDDIESAYSTFRHGRAEAPMDYAFWLSEGPPARVIWGLPKLGSASVDATTANLGRELDAALRAQVVCYDELRRIGFYAAPIVEEVSNDIFGDYRFQNLHKGAFKEKKMFQDRGSFEREYGLSRPKQGH